MRDDQECLGVMPADQEPRATQYIDKIIQLISQLIDKGFAYSTAEGDVYFRVDKFDDYGKLSKQKLDNMMVSQRITVESNKENSKDFALWKAEKNTDIIHWNTPWGKGRPGWHIECSAMSMDCLGEKFDIHGGGSDLLFPHHENEIAQSQAATGQSPVNYWMHVGMVQINEEKMSKSLGNFFTIKDILKQYHPEVIRYFLLSSHYRSALSYSDASLNEAKRSLSSWYFTLQQLKKSQAYVINYDSIFYQDYMAALNDDINTPKAFAVLHQLANHINKEHDGVKKEQYLVELQYLSSLLGLLQDNPQDFLQYVSNSQIPQLTDAIIEKKILDRDQAKKLKSYALADQIRQELLTQGVVLEDTRLGTQWRRL